MRDWLRLIPPFVSAQTLNPRLGFHLVGFTKQMRNQSDASVNLQIRVFRCVSLIFCEFQLVEHRLERLSDESHDGAASHYKKIYF